MPPLIDNLDCKIRSSHVFAAAAAVAAGLAIMYLNKQTPEYTPTADEVRWEQGIGLCARMLNSSPVHGFTLRDGHATISWYLEADTTERSVSVNAPQDHLFRNYTIRQLDSLYEEFRSRDSTQAISYQCLDQYSNS